MCLIIAITRGGKYILQQLVTLHMRTTHTHGKDAAGKARSRGFCRHAACRANRRTFLEMGPQDPKGQKRIPAIN